MLYGFCTGSVQVLYRCCICGDFGQRCWAARGSIWGSIPSRCAVDFSGRSGVDLRSDVGRLAVDPGSICGRIKIDRGPLAVELRPIGVDLRSIWGRLAVDRGSIRGGARSLPICGCRRARVRRSRPPRSRPPPRGLCRRPPRARPPAAPPAWPRAPSATSAAPPRRRRPRTCAWAPRRRRTPRACRFGLCCVASGLWELGLESSGGWNVYARGPYCGRSANGGEGSQALPNYGSTDD